MGEHHQRQTPQLGAQIQALQGGGFIGSALQSQHRCEAATARRGQRPPGQQEHRQGCGKDQGCPSPAEAIDLQPEALLQLKTQLRQQLIRHFKGAQQQANGQPEQQGHQPMPVRAMSSTSAIERI